LLLSKRKRWRQLAAVLETGNLLMLRLLLRNRSCAAMYPSRVFREYMSLVRHDQWSCRSIFDVLPPADEITVTIQHIQSDVIATPLEQLACLAMITRAFEPRTIFEIGTFTGRTALNFAINSPKDCLVYTMDLPLDNRHAAAQDSGRADSEIIRHSETGRDYRGTEYEDKIQQLYADSQTFDFTSFEGQVDMVYIDGAHHYEAVCRDTRSALQMLRPGGHVLWDEFAMYGDYNDVTRAVRDCVSFDQVVQIENTQLAVWRKPSGAPPTDGTPAKR
jgi:predicted O-methyltransferase YrrM